MLNFETTKKSFFQVADGESTPPSADARNGAQVQREAELLDAYSQAVIGVVGRVGPAVIAVGPHPAEQQPGQGSGFIITPDGFALTNSHVVHGRQRVRAITEEGDSLDARLIGDDPSTDLALIRVAARDLPSAELGDSDSLQVGQLVIAMGTPFGFCLTVLSRRVR